MGVRLIALLIVFAFYTAWFVGVGPFAALYEIEGYRPLEGRGFYTGEEALAAIQSLDEAGRIIKLKALGFDLIYMVLQTLVFEALMAFGLRHLGWMKRRWRYVLILPMTFLLFDCFIPCIVISFGLAIAGSVAYLVRR